MPAMNIATEVQPPFTLADDADGKQRASWRGWSRAVDVSHDAEGDALIAKRKRNRTAEYQRTREDVLYANPLCVLCEAEGLTVAAVEVDHIKPLHLGGTDDPSNLQGLCLRHHALKSAKEKREAGAKRMMRGHLPDGTPLARLMEGRR